MELQSAAAKWLGADLQAQKSDEVKRSPALAALQGVLHLYRDGLPGKMLRSLLLASGESPPPGLLEAVEKLLTLHVASTATLPAECDRPFWTPHDTQTMLVALRAATIPESPPGLEAPPFWTLCDFTKMLQALTRPTGTLPPGLESPIYFSLEDVAEKLQALHRVSLSQRRAEVRFRFTGWDPEGHWDFELPPRLIGRGGVNTRSIADACKGGGKARIRGRGSGHREPVLRDGIKLNEEADIVLELALSCEDEGSLRLGWEKAEEILDKIQEHFKRYLRKKNIGETELFTVHSNVARR